MLQNVSAGTLEINGMNFGHQLESQLSPRSSVSISETLGVEVGQIQHQWFGWRLIIGDSAGSVNVPLGRRISYRSHTHPGVSSRSFEFLEPSFPDILKHMAHVNAGGGGGLNTYLRGQRNAIASLSFNNSQVEQMAAYHLNGLAGVKGLEGLDLDEVASIVRDFTQKH